jgi:long-chain acyl-CoA synthetase
VSRPTTLWPLVRACQVAPRATAVVCGERTLTYAQTLDRCRRLIAALAALGLERGDRVAVVARNCHQYLELLQAIPGAGMVVVPLAPSLGPRELRHALEDSGARVAFASAPLPERSVRHAIRMGAGYEALVAGAEPGDVSGGIAEDSLAGLFYTGGTTGPAKGVMLTHRNLVANALHIQTCLPFGPDMRWLIAAPLFHVSGSLALLATAWNAGSHVVLDAFEPGRLLDLAARHGATATLLVPSALAAVADEQLARPRDVRALRHICHGGAPIATETLRRTAGAFPRADLLHLYGATETAPIATALPREQLVLDTPRARSCGRPVVGVQVAIVARDGTQTVTGEIGEVAISGPNVMRGYWNRPDATRAALVDGSYRTGDLGYLDDEGFLYLVDRAEDAIVSDGHIVSSTEVEDTLYRHPAVAEAAVFAAPGEAIHAVVVPRAPVTAAELIAHCRALSPAYAIPHRVELTDRPLAKSAAGKVLKQALRNGAALSPS